MLFREYEAADRARCLEVFDANCPAFFAPNERSEYEAFLEGVVRAEVGAGHGRDVSGYRVCLVEGQIVGAFGMVDDPGWHLHWIMIDTAAQGRGVGSMMMTRVSEIGDGRPVSIAASQKSAPFFARFGARVVETTPDGWGPGVHRVDMEL